MPPPIIREIAPHELLVAASVAGRAMSDNPLTVAVVGPDAARRTRVLTGIFGTVLHYVHRHGVVLGAFSGERLVGVCGCVRPDHAEPTFIESIVTLASLLRHARSATPRALSWLNTWAKYEPAEPHWHLGPVAVASECQHQGIGSALLDALCARIDPSRDLAYLETDKAINVAFYERAGFTVVREAEVIGVPNWFMLRKAAATPTSSPAAHSARA